MIVEQDRQVSEPCGISTFKEEKAAAEVTRKESGHNKGRVRDDPTKVDQETSAFENLFTQSFKGCPLNVNHPWDQ